MRRGFCHRDVVKGWDGKRLHLVGKGAETLEHRQQGGLSTGRRATRVYKWFLYCWMRAESQAWCMWQEALPLGLGEESVSRMTEVAQSRRGDKSQKAAFKEVTL